MINTESLIYQDDKSTFSGTFAYDASWHEPRPGVLVAHTFRGQSAFEDERAKRLAELGYCALAIDLYGEGKRASEEVTATKLMNELNDDRSLLADRMRHAWKILCNQELVNAEKTAAIGFCFGGKCVIDLARTGVPIQGVVSFHGIYDPPPLVGSEKIQAKVLLLHGWNDPLAPPQSVLNICDELTQRQADWQLQAFGHTGHAFTNPNAADHQGGMFYQDNADRRSWLAMCNFLEEIFN